MGIRVTALAPVAVAATAYVASSSPNGPNPARP